MVYLGLFSKIFEWIWNKILAPVVNFVATLLGKVFEWIFNTVLKPILTEVLKTVLPWFLDLLKDLFGKLLYSILSCLFWIIDKLNIGFDILAGSSKVIYQGKSVTLLNAMLSQSVISKAFWIITALGLGIAMILCIYAVAKSAMDLDFENKRPVGAVMRSMLKCFLQFLTIPFFIIFILQLSGILLNVFEDAAFNNSGNKAGSLGCILFAITSLDAAKKNTSLNLSDVSSTGSDLLTSGVRGKFYAGDPKYSYLNIDKVGENFNFGDFDYLVGICISCFLVVILAACCLTFIRRIFEIIILYLCSPLFVSTMPLDDGEKFKKWREMFITKVFSGYGSVLAMKLYLTVCPIIIGNSIQWGSSQTSLDATYFIKLIFLVGGAWAMLKIGPMITAILNFRGSYPEEMNIALVSHSFSRLTKGTFHMAARTAGNIRKKASSAGKNPERTEKETKRTAPGQEQTKQRYR